MRFFSRFSIRTKLTIVISLILAIVCIVPFLYFPARLRQQALTGLTQKAAALGEMTAFSLGPALDQEDRTAVAAALTGIRRNYDLAFLVVDDRHGASFATFNDLIAEQGDMRNVAMLPIGEGTAIYPHLVRPAGGQSRESFGGFSADRSLFITRTPVRHEGKVVGTVYLGFDASAVQSDVTRSRIAIAMVTVFAFGFGVAAIFAISTFITGPLSRIARTAEKFADGELTERAHVASGDEVGQLARSFNVMLDRVSQAQGQLSDLNRDLEGRVEQRTREAMQELEERRRAEERYRLLVDRNLAGVYVATEDFRVISCNDACARMFGYQSSDEFLRERGEITYSNRRDREIIIRRLQTDGAVTNEEVFLEGREGRTLWALANVRLVSDPAGGVTFEGIMLDITDRKRAEEDIAYRAYHDPLTELPNRALFRDRLTIAIAHAERLGNKLAVMFLDLDELKMINDTFGHGTGDELLKRLAARLNEMVRKGDTVARVGGDEFLILLPHIRGEQDASLVAQKVLEQLSEPVLVHGEELHLTTSIGVAIYPADGTDAETLIRHADGAMYGIKERGGNQFQLATRSSARTLGRLSLEHELRAALERDEFTVYYQPQVSFTTGDIVGIEALVRWQSAEDSIVEPATFIPVAEHSGLISQIGDIVLRKTCQQYAEWKRAGFQVPRVGVNVSARQFYQRDFVGTLEQILDETGVVAENLELEITETVAMQKTGHGLRVVRRLRDLGLSIAIDDFGTGQASFSYLKRFPVDTVKIDKSFVREIAVLTDESIVMAILLLARQLKLRTVAEGVELASQRDFLRENGCDSMQGYLVSRPVPAVTFEAMFLRRGDAAAIDLQSILGLNVEGVGSA